MASGGYSPFGALLVSFLLSDICWTARDDDDKPLAMFGVAGHPDYSDVGIPWFLGRPDVNQHVITMVREGRRFVRLMATLYDSLVQAVHYKQVELSDWVAKLGFQRAGLIEEHGVGRKPFYIYTYHV